MRFVGCERTFAFTENFEAGLPGKGLHPLAPMWKAALPLPVSVSELFIAGGSWNWEQQANLAVHVVPDAPEPGSESVGSHIGELLFAD